MVDAEVMRQPIRIAKKKTKKQKTLTVALGVSLTDSASVPG